MKHSWTAIVLFILLLVLLSMIGRSSSEGFEDSLFTELYDDMTGSNPTENANLSTDTLPSKTGEYTDGGDSNAISAPRPTFQQPNYQQSVNPYQSSPLQKSTAWIDNDPHERRQDKHIDEIRMVLKDTISQLRKDDLLPPGNNCNCDSAPFVNRSTGNAMPADGCRPPGWLRYMEARNGRENTPSCPGAKATPMPTY